MPQKLVLFSSSKVEREAAEFSWQREREAGAPLLSSFSFLSYLPPHLIALSLCLWLSCPSLLGAPPSPQPTPTAAPRSSWRRRTGTRRWWPRCWPGAPTRTKASTPSSFSRASFTVLEAAPRCPPQRPALSVSSLSLPPCPSPPPRSNFGTSAPFLGRLGANGSLPPQQLFPSFPPRIPSSRA